VTSLLTVAETLAEALAKENAALLAMDLSRVAALVADKAAALRALADAQTRGPIRQAQRPAAEQLGARLGELLEQNKRLLEIAMQVQGRVLATIARALPGVMAPAPRYGANGVLAAARRTAPMALSARV
jgi:hypothetical protein